MSDSNEILSSALSKILENEASEETREIKNTILRRIAEESEEMCTINATVEELHAAADEIAQMAESLYK